MAEKKMTLGAMLNAYPNSIGSDLSQVLKLLKKEELADAFHSCYILPSIFNTDLDRGFSLIDYGINTLMGSRVDIGDLKNLNIDLALDFILNHAAVLSKEFQDILKYGDESKYRDIFIDWNRFFGGPRYHDRGQLYPARRGAYQGYVLPQARSAHPHGPLP